MSQARLLCFAVFLAAVTPAQATNTGKDAVLRVTLHDGTEIDGRVRFKKTKLEVKGRKTKKILYRDISSISMVPAPTPEKLLRQFKRKKRRLREGENAKAWARLGAWARKRGLEDEGLSAYEAALEIDPENAAAHGALGEIRDGDHWAPGLKILGERRRAIEDGDNDALVELARFALERGLKEEGFEFLCEVMRADIWHVEALKLAGPITAARAQRTQKLVWPLTGRWKVSADRSRHHQKKSYAVYALDLNKVNAQGKYYTGKGRRLKDYYAWGAPFYAMAPGTVVEVREGRPDNPIGKLKGRAEKHNGVSIDHGNGEYTWYVHAKKGSIVVKEGQKVEAGDLLGQVGNSGGSAIPHMHVTLIAYRTISVPWACDDYTILAPDGTPIPVTRAWPREGWTVVTPEREPKKKAAPKEGTRER